MRQDLYKGVLSIKIGIIGGSGLDDPKLLKDEEELHMPTQYGNPSSPLKEGKIHGVDVVLLSRHGKTHTLPPSQVNYRANIFALKEAGCTHILATTACGSLREQIQRGDFVVLDQFIDFTRQRKTTFFEEFVDGNIKHASMARPFDEKLRGVLISACRKHNVRHHTIGTVITIEGPRFSTKAESLMFRQWGADVINMSIAPEAALANELGIPYAAIAMSTDYDSWKDDEHPVTWEEVLEVFKKNVHIVTELLVSAVEELGNGRA